VDVKVSVAVIPWKFGAWCKIPISVELPAILIEDFRVLPSVSLEKGWDIISNSSLLSVSK
jgi:hypothetical protein